MVKNPPATAGDVGSTRGLERCLGEGNSNLLQYSCHENPMNSMKRKKDMTPDDETPRSEGVQYAPMGKSRGQLLIAPERMKQLGQSRSDSQVWMCLVVKVKSNAVENNIP